MSRSKEVHVVAVRLEHWAIAPAAKEAMKVEEKFRAVLKAVVARAVVMLRPELGR